MSDPQGVMDESYAKERKKRPHIIFRYRVRAKVVADAVREFIGAAKPLRILDFGSAEGLTLLELDGLLPDASFVGVEYSESLLRCVPKLPDNIRIMKGDVTSLPEDVKNGGYDVVSALAVLEHLDNPELAVRAAAAALRPGGIFVATCPNPFWENVSTKLGLLKGDHHAGELTLDKMSEIAQKEGLRVVSKKPFMWAPIAFLPYLKAPVDPGFSLRADEWISMLRLLDWLFVNQCIIARKPA